MTSPDTARDAAAGEQLLTDTRDDTVTVTSHADFRWVERAREFSCRPAAAWRRASQVSLGCSRDFCEVRHDPVTDKLLCMRDGELITVLHAAYESVQPPQGQHECANCGRCRNTPTSPCTACGAPPGTAAGGETRPVHRRGGK